MAALRRPPRPAPMTLNLAPMVDVMMCLIIFFLLASKLATELQPVDLPWARSARKVDPASTGENVTITVRPTGTPGAAAFVFTDWDGQQIIERSLLPEDVESLLRARAHRARDGGRTLRCVIRADREVLYRHVEVVLRACGRARVRHVVFPANIGDAPEEQT